MRSLNARTLLGAGLVLIVFMFMTALALERAFVDSATTAQRQRLLGQLYLLMGETEVGSDGQLRMPPQSSIARLNQANSGLYARISHAGKPLWQSASALDPALPFARDLRPGDERFQAQAGDGLFSLGLGVEWLARESTLPLSFAVLEDGSDFTAQIRGYRQTLWGWLFGLGGGLLCALVLVLRWGLRPLQQVTADLAGIEQGRQSHLEGRYPRELQGLTGNLNALLDHERARQLRYQHALGDLAHSLKTPLAVLRGARHDCEDIEVLAETVEEQVALMDSIVSRELQRAATRGRVSLAQPIAIPAQLTRLVDALHKVYRDKAMRVSLDIDAGFNLRMDSGDFTELFGNLLDNAFKYGERQIHVRAHRQQGECLLTLCNDGPSLDPADCARLLQRGSRLDQTLPGQGIGLAVARDIIEAYQGRLEIGPADGGGACISVSLPHY